MSDSIRVEFDLSAYRRDIAALVVSANSAMSTILTAPQYGFVRKAQVYLCTQIDRAMRDNGDIAEGQSKMVRGALWRGFAERQVMRARYGATARVGTRGYERRFRRGLGFRGPLSRSYYENQRRTYRGSLSAKEHKARAGIPTKDRAPEYVYRQRASGARYSASSKLMQDTGRLRAGMISTNTSVRGGIIEIRPGANISYFEYQNDLREMWRIDSPVDEPVLTGYLQHGADMFAGAMWSGS